MSSYADGYEAAKRDAKRAHDKALDKAVEEAGDETTLLGVILSIPSEEFVLDEGGKVVARAISAHIKRVFGGQEITDKEAGNDDKD